MVTLILNGQTVEFEPGSTRSLLDFLRNQMNLIGPRFGCGEGLCGACTVLVDGQPTTSCDLHVSAVEGKTIVTLEGLGTEDGPHPLQTAFIDEQAMQCGFCVSGIIVTAAALLQSNPEPTDTDIRHGLQNNLCRCGSHNRVVRAIQRAAAAMRNIVR